MEWLKIVEDVLQAYADLGPWLEPPLMGYARANYEDLREQLDTLVHPGFVREVDKSRLQHFPRYLNAMRLRAERLRQDATRDQARMLTRARLLARVPGAQGRTWRGCRAGRIALVDRGIACIAICAGTEDHRAGVAETAEQVAGSYIGISRVSE